MNGRFCHSVRWYGMVAYIALGCSSPVAGTQKLAVSGDDLVHLWRLVEERDGGPLWHQMMDKTLPSMSYKAWRRDTEVALLSP